MQIFNDLHFIRRFWNQILICLSVRWRRLARSIRRGRHKYLLTLNSFSNSISCTLVYAVLDLFWLTPVLSSLLVISSEMKNHFCEFWISMRMMEQFLLVFEKCFSSSFFLMHIFSIETFCGMVETFFKSRKKI